MVRLLFSFGVAASVFASAPAAQARPNSGRRVALVAGPLFVSQRDAKASPVRYGGSAPFLEIGYTTQTARRRLDLQAGLALGTLRSALTRGDLPHQRMGRGWVNLEYARAVGSPDSRTQWFVGGRLSARGTVSHHRYGVSGANDGAFAFFTTTLGPVIGVERASGQRTLSAGLNIPLVALIGRPYSVLAELYKYNPTGAGLQTDIATITAFQAAYFRAAYTVTHRSGANLVLGYHATVERFSEAEPFRFASQAVALTLVWRVGGS